MIRQYYWMTVIFFCVIFFAAAYPALGQTVTPTDTLTPSVTATPTPDQPSQDEQVQQLQAKITDLQAKITDLQGKGRTLSSQIGVMDSQIKLTEYRIVATKQQLEAVVKDIETTSKKITTLEGSINDLTKVMLKRIVATYQTGTIPPFQALLASTDFSDFFARLNYLRIAQAHDKKMAFDTQQAKEDYANQKDIFETKKKQVLGLQTQLESYSQQLDEGKKGKQQLLTVTRNDEAQYQKLLKEAQAQIAAFKSFSSSQGGGILPPQPSPDGWYYNQRDERWGRNNIGSSSESVWEVGCLITSTAMIRKQRGENVTPADVARESSFFFSSTAMMLIPWNGGRFTSKGKDLAGIDSKLASGQPVIVGLYAGPYGTHFIVLKSGSGGSYTMNDPWHGPNLNFTDYYSTGQIFQYGFYNG